MPLVGIGTPPPTPHPQASVPPPPGFGGRGTLAGEKGVGRVPIPTRGIHCGTLYMYVLCAVQDLLIRLLILPHDGFANPVPIPKG
jgi:hypothetical protein